MAASPTVGRDSQRLPNSKKSSQEQQQSQPIDASPHDNTSLAVNLPGKLSMLGKVTSLSRYYMDNSRLFCVRTLVFAKNVICVMSIRKLYSKGKMHRKLLFKH